MQYKLFDIQRNSFVDGPGIRTVVFFRGCNLRCKWCHNPESQSGEKVIFHYKNKCVNCGKCTSVCQNKAIVNGVIDYSKCNFCGKCETYCMKDALRVSGFEINEDDLLAEIVKDIPYYEQTNGGVTFSGGECMLYPQHLKKILQMCKSHGIHTSIDTAGDVPFESFEEILEYTDLFLYDIKMLDNQKHIEYTTAHNTRILENLKKLFDKQCKIWIRVPVIPGVNDSEEEIQSIKDFLSNYNPEKIEFLPYHSFGENKYAALNISYDTFQTHTSI